MTFQNYNGRLRDEIAQDINKRLRGVNAVSDIEKHWHQIKESINNTCEKHLMQPAMCGKQGWMTPDILQLMERKHKKNPSEYR